MALGSLDRRIINSDLLEDLEAKFSINGAEGFFSGIIAGTLDYEDFHNSVNNAYKTVNAICKSKGYDSQTTERARYYFSRLEGHSVFQALKKTPEAIVKDFRKGAIDLKDALFFPDNLHKLGTSVDHFVRFLHSYREYEQNFKTEFATNKQKLEELDASYREEFKKAMESEQPLTSIMASIKKNDKELKELQKEHEEFYDSQIAILIAFGIEVIQSVFNAMETLNEELKDIIIDYCTTYNYLAPLGFNDCIARTCSNAYAKTWQSRFLKEALDFCNENQVSEEMQSFVYHNHGLHYAQTNPELAVEYFMRVKDGESSGEAERNVDILLSKYPKLARKFNREVKAVAALEQTKDTDYLFTKKAPISKESIADYKEALKTASASNEILTIQRIILSNKALSMGTTLEDFKKDLYALLPTQHDAELCIGLFGVIFDAIFVFMERNNSKKSAKLDLEILQKIFTEYPSIKDSNNLLKEHYVFCVYSRHKECAEEMRHSLNKLNRIRDNEENVSEDSPIVDLLESANEIYFTKLLRLKKLSSEIYEEAKASLKYITGHKGEIYQCLLEELYRYSLEQTKPDSIALVTTGHQPDATKVVEENKELPHHEEKTEVASSRQQNSKLPDNLQDLVFSVETESLSPHELPSKLIYLYFRYKELEASKKALSNNMDNIPTSTWHFQGKTYQYSNSLDSEVCKLQNKAKYYAIIDQKAFDSLSVEMHQMFKEALATERVVRSYGQDGIKFCGEAVELKVVKSDFRLYTNQILVNKQGDHLIVFTEAGKHKDAAVAAKGKLVRHFVQDVVSKHDENEKIQSDMEEMKRLELEYNSLIKNFAAHDDQDGVAEASCSGLAGVHVEDWC